MAKKKSSKGARLRTAASVKNKTLTGRGTDIRKQMLGAEPEALLRAALRRAGVSDDVLCRVLENGLFTYQISIGGANKTCVTLRLQQTESGQWSVTVRPTSHLIELIESAGFEVAKSR